MKKKPNCREWAVLSIIKKAPATITHLFLHCPGTLIVSCLRYAIFVFFSIWWTCIIWYVSGFVSLIWCVVAYICSIDDLFKFVLAPPLNCHLTRFLFYCHGLKGKWDDYLLVVIKIKGKLPLILMLVGR